MKIYFSEPEKNTLTFECLKPGDTFVLDHVASYRKNVYVKLGKPVCPKGINLTCNSYNLATNEFSRFALDRAVIKCNTEVYVSLAESEE